MARSDIWRTMARNRGLFAVGLVFLGLILAVGWRVFTRDTKPITLKVNTEIRDQNHAGRVTVEVIIRVPTSSVDISDYGVVFDPLLVGALVTVPGTPPIRRGHSRRLSAFVQLPEDRRAQLVRVMLVQPDGSRIFAESPPVTIGSAPR
jgi:hypothetical protein